MIKVIALLCQISNPSVCHEQTVTTSDFSEISLTGCLMGMPQLAEWMKQHPAERLAKWKCVVGERAKGSAI